jgi:hypothetical protein
MTYFFLLAIQLFGAIFFICHQLPEFRQVVNNPGVQLPKDTYSDLLMLGVSSAMQTAFWFRVYHVPIPFRRPNLFLNYILLFLGRLSWFSGIFPNWALRPTFS